MQEIIRRTVPPGYTVREVPLPPGQLHLKCGVSQPHPGFILLADTMPFSPFAREEVRVVGDECEGELGARRVRGWWWW